MTSSDSPSVGGPPSDAIGDVIAPVDRPRLVNNLFALMSSQLVTWALALILNVVLPRFVGPDDLGQLRLAAAIWAIAALFGSLGTSVFLTIEIARDEARGSRLVGPVLVLKTIAFVVISGVLTVIAAARGIDSELAVLLAIAGVGTLIDSIASVYSSALSGLEQMSALATSAIASRVLHTLVLLAILFAGGDVVAVGVGALAGSLAAAMIVMRSYRKVAVVRFGDWISMTPAVLRGSLVFFLAGAALIVYQQVDTVVMAAFVDRSALGWYTTADTLFSSLLFVPTVLLASIFPRMSRLYEHDRDELGQLIQQSFATLLLMGVPIGLGTIVVAREFAPLLFGDDYQETGPVLQVFGVVTILVFGTILLGGVARAVDRQRFWVWVMVIGIVVTIPLDVVLVPWADRRFGNGAIGGALTFVVTEAFMLGMGIWKIAPSITDRAMLVRIAKIVLSGGVMFAATWPLRHQLFVVPALLGAVVYSAMIAVSGALSAHERRLIADLRRRLIKR